MILTVTAYKRPDLLQRCLESIAAADLTPVSAIAVSCDRHSDEMFKAMWDVWQSIKKTKDPRWLVPRENKMRLGVANHPRYIINRVIGLIPIGTYPYPEFPASAICSLEEDTIVSPDCFVFAEWAMKQRDYQFVNLAPGSNFNFQPFFSQAVHEDWELRSPYGWAFTPAFWRLLEPQWNGKIRAPYGWDWQLSHLCYREGWHSLTPEVARVYNTGRENGTYDTPDNWDATQRDVVICQASPYSIKYNIVTHQRPEKANWPEWVLREIAQ